MSEESDVLGEPTSPRRSNVESGMLSKKGMSTLRVVILGLIVIVPGVAPGMSFGFPAVALPQLNLNIDEASTFASLGAIAMPIGCLLSGPVIDRYGRRTALMLINLPSFMGWLLIASKPHLTRLYVARLLTGLAVGLATTPAAVYSAECLTVHKMSLRGSLTTWSTVALTSGILLVYFTGALLAYTTVAIIASAISLLSLVLISLFIPESPTWLIDQGRFDDAENADKILKIHRKRTASECSQLIPKDSPKEKKEEFFSMETIRKTVQDFREPEAYKPLVIMITFLFFQQFSGLYVMITYMVDIISSAGVEVVNPYLVTVISGVVILIAAISVTFLLPIFGVRKLSMFSCLGVSVSMLTYGMYLSVRSKVPWVSNYPIFGLIPVFAIVLNVWMSGIGFIPIPYSMLGEVFPPHVKGTAGGIASSLSSIFCFIAIKTYPYLFLNLEAGIFYLYGTLALFASLFVIYYLPETRGRTLEEINSSFSSKKKSEYEQH
nr:PREDICTED: facilitated trehalose transporter Tret1-like [Bemisia tabaci]XP_018910832.1 PREDICTED: facilitated trehalose transporter Tret1-like [Bemisia tabaci]